MASRKTTFSLKCPPDEAPPAAKATYRRLFRAAPVAASLFEGDFTLRITKRQAGQSAARKRATSRKRR